MIIKPQDSKCVHFFLYWARDLRGSVANLPWLEVHDSFPIALSPATRDQVLAEGNKTLVGTKTNLKD